MHPASYNNIIIAHFSLHRFNRAQSTNKCTTPHTNTEIYILGEHTTKSTPLLLAAHRFEYHTQTNTFYIICDRAQLLELEYILNKHNTIRGTTRTRESSRGVVIVSRSLHHTPAGRRSRFCSCSSDLAWPFCDRIPSIRLKTNAARLIRESESEREESDDVVVHVFVISAGLNCINTGRQLPLRQSPPSVVASFCCTRVLCVVSGFCVEWCVFAWRLCC